MYTPSRKWHHPALQPRPSLRAQKKAATAERIFRAALALFRERGYAETRVEEIARAAGVSKGTFFNYFPTKEAVLAHLGRRQMRALQTALAAAADFADRPARAQFAFVLDTLAAGLEGDRELIRPVLFELYRVSTAFAEGANESRRLFELLDDLARRGQARGELRADVPSASIALLVGAAYFHTLVAWLDLDEAPPLAALLRAHLDLLLEGMAT